MNSSIDNMCRTCLSSDGNLISIFDEKSVSVETSSLANMIKAVTTVQMSISDGLPNKICLLCFSEVNRAYSFRIKCENSDTTLKQFFNEQINQKKSTEENLISVNVKFSDINEISDNEKVNNNNDEISVLLDEQDNSDHRDDDDIDHESENTDIEYTQNKSVINHEMDGFYEEEKKTTDTIYVTSNDFGNDNDDLIEQCVDNDHGEQEIEIKLMNVDENQCKNDENNDKIDENMMLGCGDCNRTFENVQKFNAHCKKCTKCKNNETNRKNKLNKKPLTKCPYCPFDFVHQKNLDKHVNKYHIEKIITDSNQLQLNIKKTENDKQNIVTKNSNSQNCTEEGECIIQEFDVVYLKDNQQILNSPYKCFNCGAGFAKEKSLSFHLKLNKCTEEQFGCVSCKKVFINKESLIDHMRTHTTFECSKCSKTFSQQDKLKEHVETEHSSDKKNQCPYCSKIFTMRSSLKDHIRTHNGEKPFLCSLCGKAFTQSTNLKQHFMRHTKTKPFKCDQCDFSFVSKGELNSHIRKHTGDHPFVCDTCGSGFTTSSSLVKHKRRHTGERPYACEYCPMRFAALGILKNHRRTHTGEKPFTCKYCNRSFTQKSDCVSHMRTHTGERPYICVVCGLGFQQSGTLRTHMKTIHKIIRTKNESKRQQPWRRQLQQQEQQQQGKEQIQKILKQDENSQKLDSEVLVDMLEMQVDNNDMQNIDNPDELQDEILQNRMKSE